jgi:hypothetical protein
VLGGDHRPRSRATGDAGEESAARAFYGGLEEEAKPLNLTCRGTDGG